MPGAGIAGLNTILSTVMGNLRADEVRPTLILEKDLPGRGGLDRLLQLIRKKRIRIVHSFDGAGTGARAAALLGLPHVWSIAGTLEDTFLAGDRSSLEALPAIIEKLSRVVTVPSRALAESEFPLLPRRKLRVLPWGLDRPRPGRPHGWLKKKLRLPSQTPLIALVANFHPAKRHADFLQAARRIRHALPAARFLIGGRIVGNSPHSRSVSRRARAEVLRKIRTLGLAEAVNIASFDPKNWDSWYPEIDLLISPSREGMSLAVLQAGACGVPIVAVNIGGSPEVIQHGRTGLLVPWGRPAALAEAALRILRSPALKHRLGKGAQRRILTFFSSRKQADHLSKLYRRLLR